jgi:deoxyribonuclease V
MPHRWDLTPRQAVELQRHLRRRIRTDLPVDAPRRIAGVDVAYVRATGESVATVCVLSYPELAVVEWAVATIPTPFPYIPGLLSFREVPPILAAMAELEGPVELVFVDGHGQAHPRRMGIACHLGLWLETPTVGVGKSRLCGRFDEPRMDRGEWSDLIDRGEVVGRVVRSRRSVKPVFVSVGYGIPLEECVAWTLRVTTKYRLPEPIRQAHRLAALGKEERTGGSGVQEDK